MKIDELYKRYFTIRKCVSCGDFLDYEERDAVYCQDCRLRWSVEKTKECKICMRSAVECTCQPKELAAVGSLCLRKLVFYDKNPKTTSPQMRTVYRLKRKPHARAEKYIAHEFSHLIEKELGAIGVVNSADEAVVTSVPRGRISRRKYGIDQSERIAAAIGAEMGIPCVKAFCRAKFFSDEQKKLSRKERFKNIKRQLVLADGADVSGRYVILYDDIVTTGASMTACTSLLYKAGAKGVISVCITKNQG